MSHSGSHGFRIFVTCTCWVFIASVSAATASGQWPLEPEPSLRELLTEPTMQAEWRDSDASRLPEPSVVSEPNERSEQDPGDTERVPQEDRNASTEAHLAQLRRPLREIRLGFDAEDRALARPTDRALEVMEMGVDELVTAGPERWQSLSRYPVAFYHRPLYYQQPNLERCGQTFDCGLQQLGYLQNAASGITFLVNTMVLPYRLATERPDYPVPHQGDCRAYQSMGAEAEPLQAGMCGWLSEAAAIAGFTFLLL